MFTKVKSWVNAHKFQVLGGASCAAAGLSSVAFAETTPVTVTTVTGAFGDLFTGVGSVLAAIAAQPILLICLAAGMLSIFIGVFVKMKHAARK